MRVDRPTTSTHRRAVRTLLLLAGCCLALLLSACSSVTFQSTFDKDGTARHQVTFVFDRDNLLPADISRIELGLNSAMTRATNDGFAVQRISTSSEIGLRVMGNSIDATDTGAALNILFNTLLPTSDDAPVAPFSGTFSRESGAVGGNRFELELSADGTVLAEAIRGISPLSPQLQTPESMASVISVRVIAILPGTVRDTNGSAAGNRVTWNVPLSVSSDLNAVSTIGQSTPWLAVFGITVLAAMATGATGYLGWILMRRRHVPPGIASEAAEVVDLPPRTDEADLPPTPFDQPPPPSAPEDGSEGVPDPTDLRTLPGLAERLRLVAMRFITDPRPPRPPRSTRGTRSTRPATEIDRRERATAAGTDGTSDTQTAREYDSGIDAEGD